jgi:hypothetical protein
VTAPARIFLAKPGVDTRFHIDFDWWEREGRDFRIDVTKHLLPEYVDSFTGINSGEMIDLVDAETGAVTQVDTAQYTLRTKVKPVDPFLNAHTSLVDAVFHLLLVNGNRPMSPNELSALLNRPAQTILRTLAGRVVYKGLRPIVD